MTANKDIKTAVIIRTQDGVLQPMLLGIQPNAALYRLTGCVLRKVGCGRPERRIAALCDLPADVFVFVNAPIETTNHVFLDELAGYALREDCGVVSGVWIDDLRIILHAGWEVEQDGAMRDRYAGQVLTATTLPTSRRVSRISESLFAVRRDRLLQVGGLWPVHSERMSELMRRLTKAAEEDNLQLIITSRAVVTLAGSAGSLPGGHRGFL